MIDNCALPLDSGVHEVSIDAHDVYIKKSQTVFREILLEMPTQPLLNMFQRSPLKHSEPLHKGSIEPQKLDTQTYSEMRMSVFFLFYILLWNSLII